MKTIKKLVINMLNDQQARVELKDILNQKEYQVYYDQPQNFLQIWWEKAKEWLAQQLEKLFPAFEPSSGTASILLIGLILIAVIILGLLALRLARNYKRNRMLYNKNPLQSQNKHWTYADHLSEAKRCENIEEYTMATRHMFLALLLYFHEKEWLAARIWKTNWDYYDELSKVDQNWAEQFFHLALLFDEAAYGNHQVAKEEYISFSQQAMQWLSKSEEPAEG